MTGRLTMGTKTLDDIFKTWDTRSLMEAGYLPSRYSLQMDARPQYQDQEEEFLYQLYSTQDLSDPNGTPHGFKEESDGDTICAAPSRPPPLRPINIEGTTTQTSLTTLPQETRLQETEPPNKGRYIVAPLI